ncbi:Prolyl 4-hydroxylase 2 [Diplonema papillatum]|nr:Prolyl 4-hydroxylase 2 [Diplonema papillatum]|eukprot:gene9424-14608_t
MKGLKGYSMTAKLLVALVSAAALLFAGGIVLRNARSTQAGAPSGVGDPRRVISDLRTQLAASRREAAEANHLLQLRREKAGPDTTRVQANQQLLRDTGFKLVDAVLPAGDELGAPEGRFLRFDLAVKICKGTPGCKGFTFPSANATSSSVPTGSVQAYFKSAVRAASGVKGWRSVVVDDSPSEDQLPIDPGYPLYLKYKNFISADYDVEGVAKHGFTDKLRALWPEFDQVPDETTEALFPDLRVVYPDPGENTLLLSVAPRVYFFPGVIDEETAEAIQNQSRESLHRSLIAPGTKDKNHSGVNDVRTSQGTWLSDSSGPAKVLRIRLAKLIGVEPRRFELLQILRYQHTQKYGSHVDYFHPRGYGPRTSNRMATIITFLSNVTDGGESNFPAAHGSKRDQVDCRRGLRVQPVIGNSVVFYSMRPDMNFDPFSLHGGCPVGEGQEKWVAVQWVDIPTPQGMPPESRM